MQKSTKNTLIIGGLAAAFLGFVVYPLTVLAKFKNLVSVNITGIKSFDIIGANIAAIPPQLGQVRIKFDLIIDNPLPQDFTFTVPYIRAFIDDATFGNSIPRTEKVTVRASGRTTISDIDFRIPTMNLISMLGINLQNVQAMIAARQFRLNRKIDFVIGITVNGVHGTMKQSLTL